MTKPKHVDLFIVSLFCVKYSLVGLWKVGNCSYEKFETGKWEYYRKLETGNFISWKLKDWIV